MLESLNSNDRWKNAINPVSVAIQYGIRVCNVLFSLYRVIPTNLLCEILRNLITIAIQFEKQIRLGSIEMVKIVLAITLNEILRYPIIYLIYTIFRNFT